jgi:hypothetical protein
MSKHGVPQGRIGQPGQHRELDRAHQLSRFSSEGCESEYAVAVDVDQRLHEAAPLRNCPGAPRGIEWNEGDAVGNTSFPSLGFVQADTSQFRIGEDAGRNQAAGRRAVASLQVVEDDRRIVL